MPEEKDNERKMTGPAREEDEGRKENGLDPPQKYANSELIQRNFTRL
jgi:hypothetical protein